MRLVAAADVAHKAGIPHPRAMDGADGNPRGHLVADKYGAWILGVCHQTARVLLCAHPRRDCRDGPAVGIPESLIPHLRERKLVAAGGHHRRDGISGLSADGRLRAGCGSADGNHDLALAAHRSPLTAHL